jgi:hypothetical protein
LAAHQAGWLSACITYKDDRPKKTRAQEIIEAGREPPFIHCSNGRHLVDALQDLGRYQVTDSGRSALSWLEIGAYANATGLISEAWEMQIVREMSEAFVRGLSEGENPLSIPPAERSF